MNDWEWLISYNISNKVAGSHCLCQSEQFPLTQAAVESGNRTWVVNESLASSSTELLLSEAP